MESFCSSVNTLKELMAQLESNNDEDVYSDFSSLPDSRDCDYHERLNMLETIKPKVAKNEKPKVEKIENFSVLFHGK